MRRKIKRSLAAYEGDPEALEQALEKAIERLQELNFLDDARYARDLTARLQRRNKSLRYMRGKLREKKIPSELINLCLEGLGREADLRAALLLLRKRRRSRVADYSKELAALARAGFSCEIARRALEVVEERGPSLSK